MGRLTLRYFPCRLVLLINLAAKSDYKLPLNSLLLQTKTRQDVVVSLSINFLQILEDLGSRMNHLRQPGAVSTIDSVALEVIPQIANLHGQKGG